MKDMFKDIERLSSDKDHIVFARTFFNDQLLQFCKSPYGHIIIQHNKFYVMFTQTICTPPSPFSTRYRTFTNQDEAEQYVYNYLKILSV